MCSEISTLKRLSFAASTLPKDTPRYWELVVDFGFRHSQVLKPSTNEVKVLLENVHYLEKDARKCALLREGCIYA